MLLYLNGFWSGFSEKTNGVHYGFFESILKDVFETTIEVTQNINSADILLESHFGSSIFNIKEWKYSIFFSGEGVSSKPLPNNIDKYTFCLGSQKSNNNFISCPLYLLYDYCSPSSYPTEITSIPSKTICSVISSVIPESYRYKLLEELNQNGVIIDSGGNYKNTIGYTIPGAYYDKPIIDFQKQYRIVLALENTILDDYITEKIVNPMRAGSIPVYFGSDKIGDYFNLDRFIKVNINNIQETINEIQRLLADDLYWLEKVNKPILKKQTKDCMNDIIVYMKELLNKRTYDVEIISNLSIESNRLKTLQPIIDFYNVEPSYTVWGDEAKNHELYGKFKQLNIGEISLAINHISVFNKYRNTDKFLCIFESDVISLYDNNYIHKEIEKTIYEMKKNNIDFCFIGKGCFQDFNTIQFVIDPITKITEILHKIDASRCTESYIVSPSGIKKYIEYFNNTSNHCAIDFDFNNFFRIYTNITCWRVPELFSQGTHTNLYKSHLRN